MAPTAEVSSSASKRKPIKEFTYKSVQSHVWGLSFGLVACLLAPVVVVLTFSLGIFKSISDWVHLRLSIP